MHHPLHQRPRLGPHGGVGEVQRRHRHERGPGDLHALVRRHPVGVPRRVPVGDARAVVEAAPFGLEPAAHRGLDDRHGDRVGHVVAVAPRGVHGRVAAHRVGEVRQRPDRAQQLELEGAQDRLHVAAVGELRERQRIMGEELGLRLILADQAQHQLVAVVRARQRRALQRVRPPRLLDADERAEPPAAGRPGQQQRAKRLVERADRRSRAARAARHERLAPAGEREQVHHQALVAVVDRVQDPGRLQPDLVARAHRSALIGSRSSVRAHRPALDPALIGPAWPASRSRGSPAPARRRPTPP